MNTECVLGVVIDVCTRSFLVVGDNGNEKMIQCNNVEEFLNVKAAIEHQLDDDQIEYADLAIYYK